MSRPPTLRMLVVNNVFVLVIGGALTYLSVQTRRRVDKPSLNTVLGVGLVTLSTVAEVVCAPAVIGIYDSPDRHCSTRPSRS